MKNILFVASECVPFIKTGGLADVIGSLPNEFDPQNYDVRVILPLYSCIPWEYRNRFQYMEHFYLSLSSSVKDKYVGVFKYYYNRIHYYFIDNQEYFTCDHPYGSTERDIERFAFFDKAVLSCLPLLDFQPDIIHCNDWQTGLIPVYLKEEFSKGPFYQKMKTILTIHNLKFQGVWSIEHVKAVTGLPDYLFTPDKLDFYHSASLLKGGLVFADYITTVSETYAQEIQTDQFGEGLHGLLFHRRLDMLGILNGIDYRLFNPLKDLSIHFPYQVTDFRTQKPKNKKVLQQETGLTVDPKKFLIGIVSRLTDQKGFDLICSAIDQIIDDQTQLVIVGTGDSRYEDSLLYYASKYPGKVAAHIEYAQDLSQKIYAGADAFLMPSYFEPCGLSQLIALRYGTVPIVRETGGLKDTVMPYNQYEHTGLGFSFTHYSIEDLVQCINYSKEVFFEHKREWNHMVERGMQADYTWAKSKESYEKIYDFLSNEK